MKFNKLFLLYIKITIVNISVFLTLSKANLLYSQQQNSNTSFTYSYKKSILFYSVNSSHTLSNLIHLHYLNPKNYRTFTLKGIDNTAKKTLNKKVARAGDLLAIGTLLCTSLPLIYSKVKPKYDYLVFTAHNVWITYNITESTKNLVLRSRPYTQTTNLNVKDDRRSFISGHSSIPATIATSLWLSNPKQKWIPITASVLAIGSAISRVNAGKHYPSDVISGILVGSTVAYINFVLSKK